MQAFDVKEFFEKLRLGNTRPSQQRPDILQLSNVPKNSDSMDMSSTEQTPGVPHRDVISDFITKYKRDSQQWHAYMSHALSHLDTAVKEDGIASIVTGRVKKPAKVEEKLRKKQSFYEYGCEKHILNNMVDFIGLRVSAYFPNDQKKILGLIDRKFVTIARVYFEDDEERYVLNEGVTDDAGKEIVAYINHRYEEAMASVRQHSSPAKKESLDDDIGKEIIAYINRRYVEASLPQTSSAAVETSLPPNFEEDAVGKEFIAHINERYKKATPDNAQKTSAAKKRTNLKSLDNYQRRFGGYTAEHRWVILRSEQRQAGAQLHVQPFEIQVRSVLMDSWIAINRNIEYDALTGILSAPERRILDSIKGLAQTGELLLEQLYHVHYQRLNLDQIEFERSEDVTRVLDDYFVLEDPVENHSKDPFADLLMFILSGIGIQKPGDLKLRLTRDVIDPHCQHEFAAFRRRFPIAGSFESYVLPPLLKKLGQSERTNLLSTSHLRPSSLASVIERTLGWVGMLQLSKHWKPRFQTPLPLTCGYSCLTFLFCILVWTEEAAINSEIEKYFEMQTMLLATLLEFLELEEESTPFAIIAFAKNLYVDAKFYHQLEGLAKCDQEVHLNELVTQLASRPLEWERGVALFLQYRLKLLGMSATGQQLAEDIERTSDDISKSMVQRMASLLPLRRALQIAHKTTGRDKIFPNTHAFWSDLLEYTLLRGLEDLVDNDDESFEDWTEFFHYRGCRGWRLVKLRTIYGEITEERDHGKGKLVLFMLDCEGLSDEALEQELQFASMTPGIYAYQNLAHVIFLKNVRIEALTANGSLFGCHVGKIQLDTPGLWLVTLVKKKEYAPAQSSGAIGPLWKVISNQDNAYALVCDLFIHVGPGRPPARLRLPNCKPGTEIATRFLPSESVWAIGGNEIEADNNESLTPGVLVDGTRTNSMANGKHYMVSFTLKETTLSEACAG